MRKILLIAAAGMIGLSSHALLAQNMSSPVGNWQTVDDKTGRVKSIVKIFEVDGKLSGQIIQVFPEPGKPPDPVCDKCTGTLHNHRITGMVIMWGFHQDDDTWTGGRIFDPEKPGNNEDPYKAKLTLANGGQDLAVRGYIGFSFIGRSQTWHRVK